MKWTSVNVTFREVARVSMWTPFPGGTFVWKRSCGTIAGLNAQTGIAWREVDRQGEARHCGREAKRVSFQFSFQPPTNPDGKCRGQTGFRCSIKKTCSAHLSRPAN